MNNNSGFITFPILILAAAVAVGVVGYWGFSGTVAKKATVGGGREKACTEEAMLCPDGSYVGRTGLRLARLAYAPAKRDGVALASAKPSA